MGEHDLLKNLENANVTLLNGVLGYGRREQE